LRRECTDIAIEKRIPIEQDKTLIQQIERLTQSTSRPTRLWFDYNPQSRAADGAATISACKLITEVSGEQKNIVKALPHHVIDHNVQKPPIADHWHERFRNASGERPEPGALPAHKDNGLADYFRHEPSGPHKCAQLSQ
jgi:hypothetical protein